MTIIQLEYLLAVANHGSFSLAAEHCFVTQPTLSMQIKNLEEELGVVLFDRTRQPVVPTDAGLVVIESAREAVRAFQNVGESIDLMRGQVAGTLSVGVIPTVAPYLLPRFISGFLEQNPLVTLQISEMCTDEIVAALQRDALDCAIVSAGTCPDNIVEQELFDDRFHAYVSPQNRLYERTNIRIEDIDMREMLLLRQGHCLRNHIVELCSEQETAGCTAPFEAASLDTLMHLVDCTGYMTVIPEIAVDFVPWERRSQIVSLAKGATSRKIVLASRRTYVKSSLIEALRKAIVGIQ